MPPTRTKEKKKGRFPTPEHYDSDEVEECVTEVLNFVAAAEQNVLSNEDHREFRSTFAKIVNWTPFADDKRMDKVIAAFHKVDKGKTLGKRDAVVLKMGVGFVPDLSMSAEEDAHWMAEEAACRAGLPPVPCLTPVALTNDPLERQLRASIAQIGNRSGEAAGILSGLQELAKHHNQPVQIYPHPVMFTDERAKKHTWTGRPFAPFSTLPQFLNARANPGDHQISVALVIVWSISPTARMFKEWSEEELHALLFVQVHPPLSTPRGQVPKVLLIGDVNFSKSGDTGLLPCTRKLLEVAGVPQHNTQGICTMLALEWMLELAVQGLQIERDGDSLVTEVEGFCRLI
ncbi:hypothetical protein FB451DRAFT_1176477 [Mycena latifolia]|nr:hypothetical protein FB451DRAFT_1176477 [Mycena latifolia]